MDARRKQHVHVIVHQYVHQCAHSKAVTSNHLFALPLPSILQLADKPKTTGTRKGELF